MKWIPTLFTEWLQLIKVMDLLELLSFHGGRGKGGRAENKAECHMICNILQNKKGGVGNEQVINHESLAA